jgi:site-specific DNA-cytosine methylase
MGSCFAGIAGFDEGFRRSGWETVWQSEIEPFCRAVLRSKFPEAHLLGDIRSIALRPAFPARMSRSRAKEQDLPAHVQDSFTSLRESLSRFDPLGFCSRMFPDFSVLTREETLQKSSAFSWSSAGMGFRGASLTASFSESPRDAAVSTLSDVLESHAPQRFFLSPKAAQGILRRAKKRGRTLPRRLQEALESLATRQAADGKTTITSPTACEKTQEESDKGTTQPMSLKASSPQHSRPAEESTATGTPTTSSQPLSAPRQATTDTAVRAETEATISSSAHCCQAKTELAERDRQDRPLITPIPSSPRQLTERGQKVDQGRATTQSDSLASQDSEPADPTTTMDKPEELSVRRLTPTECETLQGFPKGWTVPDTAHWGTRSRSTSRNGLPSASGQ